jgi:hypothetical protein
VFSYGQGARTRGPSTFFERGRPWTGVPDRFFFSAQPGSSLSPEPPPPLLVSSHPLSPHPGMILMLVASDIFQIFWFWTLLSQKEASPPALSSPDDLALDWLSQEEGGFLRSPSSTSPDHEGSSFSPGGAKARVVTGFSHRSEVFCQAVSQEFPSPSKGFISAHLDVEEQRGFTQERRVFIPIF